MTCINKDIKELLPSYLEQGIDPDARGRVEKHLETCEDCRAELSLLRMMAEGPVPDPGEAFWRIMPERVFRAVQEEKKKEKRSVLSALWNGPVLPRWARATAVVGLTAVVSWLLVRPAPMDVGGPVLPANGTAFEDVVPAEPLNITELSTTELDAATAWAQNEFIPIGDAVSQDAPETTPKNIYEDLMELSPQELDRVLDMLKKKEHEAREKLHKKTVKKKDLG
jgi:predicted anti-sigma-YlaC factor YlaD